jgi:prophage antirepressor-like protein
MSSVVPFSFKGAGVRVVADDHGESWFVGRDLCSALGYADQTSAMKQHCRGVVKYHPIADSLGRMQDTRILAEPDMLRLVINSQLPAAEQFERWVFEDVLPTIRRTGSYQMPANDATIPVERQLPIAADSLDAAKRIAECFGLEGNQALLSANSMVKSAIGVDLMEMAGVTALSTPSMWPPMAAHISSYSSARWMGRPPMVISDPFALTFRRLPLVGWCESAD